MYWMLYAVTLFCGAYVVGYLIGRRRQMNKRAKMIRKYNYMCKQLEYVRRTVNKARCEKDSV